MTIKRHEAMILSRRRCSDARQKFLPAIFLSPIVVAKFIFFCAKFIISSHLATMAIGSANLASPIEPTVTNCDISDNNSQLKCMIENDIIHGVRQCNVVFALERCFNYM